MSSVEGEREIARASSSAAAEPMLQFFEAGRHNPVGMGFWQLANLLVEQLPRNAERTIALRKLLEASDAAARAVSYRETG